MPNNVSFYDAAPTPTIDFPKADRLVHGNPQRTTWLRHKNSALGFYCGEWACEQGAWQIIYGPNEEELFTVTEGHIRITAKDGQSRDYRVGDSCVIPANFEGVFQVVEACKKIFAIVER